ncbi:MAG: hypothetical protein KDA66_17335, partial [Planctomycetaceae bacterium]|nr:hypothetical protein [Planctomycetaceae bacterium]
KDEILRVSLDSGEVKAIHFELNATMLDLKLSPCRSRLIAIDRKKTLHCIETNRWSIIWTKSLKSELKEGHMGVGQFSGDGTLFGAAVSTNSGNYTLVVDSESGELVNRISKICYGLPHVGTSVRDKATREGTLVARTLDLSTGAEGAFTLNLKVD